MRAIDADALLDGYKNMGYDPTEHPEESYMEGWCKGFNAAVDHCMHHVIHAPTIEPKRKGKWKIYVISMLDGEGCKCSECGFEGAPYWDYCPSCGARMSEVEHE